MNKLTDNFKLHNGYEIPVLGFGTWKIEDGDAAINIVKSAIEIGYRHIDTAAAYGNEVSVGKAIKESGVNRKDLFITSKVWTTERGYDKTMAAFERTVSNLGCNFTRGLAKFITRFGKKRVFLRVLGCFFVFFMTNFDGF